MFGEMLATERVPTPEKRQQYLDIIVRESERLTALIENVLDSPARARPHRVRLRPRRPRRRGLSRVEMFRYCLVKERPNLTDLAADLPRDASTSARSSSCSSTSLDNAVKYAPTPSIVFVRVRQRRRPEVEDQAPASTRGRPPHLRTFTAAAPPSRRARGSGIGLRS